MTHMRKLVLFLLACSPIVAAENPFIGTWKENFAKSYDANVTNSQSGIIRIESAGENRVKITQDHVDVAGKKTQTVGEFTLDGSDTHPSGPETDFTQSFRPIGPNVWERIAKRPGDIRHGYWAVSRDGKMLIITGFGKDAKGDYYDQRVLERQ